MSRTLVTGSAGFTGRYLTDLLMACDHEVIGLVHSGDGDSRIEVRHVDLLDRERLGQIVTDVRADHVVHLAAIAHVDHGDVGALYQNNILGSRNLFDALANASVKPRSVLVASSANIYGNSDERVISEAVVPMPANDYGVTKLAVEHLARIYGDRLPIIVTRPFNYTGRGQSERFLIPKIVGHAKRQEKVLSLGNLDVARDFSDVRMVVDAYAKLLNTPSAIGKTINVCSGRATSLREVIAMTEALSGHQFQVQVDPCFVRSNEVRELMGSNALLRQHVGDLAISPLQDTLNWMLG